MKKIIFLLIVPLFFFGLVKKVNAASYGYEMRFTSLECYVPLGGNVYDYLPTAYIYDTINDCIETDEDISYSYDYQGIKFSNIDTSRPCHSFGYITATHPDYSCSSGLTRIEVYVVDDVKPVVSISSTINLSYKDDFNILNYVTYSDNIDEVCNVTLLGNYIAHVIGDYELSVKVTDNSNNSTTKSFILHIYDNIRPVIECDNIIKVDINSIFNKNDYIKVYDEYDGIIDYDMPVIDTTTINDCEVTISAKDASNNTNTKTITISVCDKVSPVIELENTELNVMEDYDFKSNIKTISDNYDTLTLDNVEVSKKLIGTQRYLITYSAKDNSKNETIVYAYANIDYYNKPVIEGINIDDLTDVFDPLHYVKAYDVEDGDLTDKVMVVEMNYEEKYCIYEVYDSNSNAIRVRINFINEEEKEKYENKNKIVMPSDTDIEQNPISNSETVKNVTEYKTTNYNFLYYIILGVFVLGIIIFILVKHFRKKMV